MASYTSSIYVHAFLERTPATFPSHVPLSFLIANSPQESLPASCPTPTIIYTIIHSPSYSVPVLYISIKDALFRFPPTQETLYNCIIPTQYKTQTGDENAGVLGGITITVSLISVLCAIVTSFFSVEKVGL
jgi:hypothetical protein